MTLEENKAFIRRYIEEVNHQRDVDAIDRYVASDVVNWAATPERRHGLAGYKEIVANSLRMMPDQRWEVDLLIAEDDLVVVYGSRRATWLGTHFRGIATPTGQTVDVELVHIFRIRDGMITEHWAVRDDVAMFQQLGGPTQLGDGHAVGPGATVVVEPRSTTF